MLEKSFRSGRVELINVYLTSVITEDRVEHSSDMPHFRVSKIETILICFKILFVYSTLISAKFSYSFHWKIQNLKKKNKPV